MLHLLPGLWRVDGYAAILRYLERRFELTAPSADRPGNYIRFAYDWRLSNVASARRLQATVERELARWRARNGRTTEAKVVFVCHSMGGLVAQYYIEALGGVEVTRRVITIGTPFRGSVNALDCIVNRYKPGWGPLRIDLTDLLASFPSTYQLLPTYRCLATPSGLQALTEVPIEGLDQERLMQAARFHSSMTPLAARGRGYDVIAIKGQTQPTALAAEPGVSGVRILETYGGEALGGDGTVPRFSSHPAEWANEMSGHIIFAPERHASLQNDRSVHNQLDGFLTTGKVTRPMGGRQIGVALPDMIDAGQSLNVDVVAEEEDLQLVVAIDNCDGVTASRAMLTNLGGGSYRARIDGLASGAYRVTVGPGAPSRPVAAVTDVVVVWDQAADDLLIR